MMYRIVGVVLSAMLVAAFAVTASADPYCGRGYQPYHPARSVHADPFHARHRFDGYGYDGNRFHFVRERYHGSDRVTYATRGGTFRATESAVRHTRPGADRPSYDRNYTAYRPYTRPGVGHDHYHYVPAYRRSYSDAHFAYSRTAGRHPVVGAGVSYSFGTHRPVYHRPVHTTYSTTFTQGFRPYHYTALHYGRATRGVCGPVYAPRTSVSVRYTYSR